MQANLHDEKISFHYDRIISTVLYVIYARLASYLHIVSVTS